MESIKIVQILESFTKNELNSFDKYLHSPFHNEDREMIKIYENGLVRMLAQGISPGYEDIWNGAFPNSKLQYEKLKKKTFEVSNAL